jgi:type VI secretion system protein ImpK
MRDELADLVYPVLEYGLSLRERLEAGGRGMEEPALEAEQATLQGLLLPEADARRWPDYGGDPGQPGVLGSGASESGVPAAGVTGPPGHASRFLGVRYALVCWLDELFVLDSPWAERWNEHKLEVLLYASNDRAWKFWDQARQAAVRGAGPLEAFFLCVLLGFRGELGEDPGRLSEWIAQARALLTRAPGRGWTAPPALEPPTNVPPLHGRRRLQRLILIAGAVLLAVLPVVAFFLALAGVRSP